MKRITISLSEKLPTALVSQRVARLMQTFDKKYARRVFSRWKVRLAPPVISGPCFAKEVEVSELLRVYLAEHDRTLFPIRFPANWNFDNQNNKTCSKVPGEKKSRGEQKSAGVFQEDFHQITKAGPRNFCGGVSDIRKASLSLFPTLWIH